MPDTSLARRAAAELHPFVHGETVGALIDCIERLLAPMLAALPDGGKGWVDGDAGEVGIVWANFPDGSVWNLCTGPGRRPIDLPEFTPGRFVEDRWVWDDAE